MLRCARACLPSGLLSRLLVGLLAGVSVSLLAGCATQRSAITSLTPEQIEDVGDQFQPFDEYLTPRWQVSIFPNLIGLQLVGRRDRSTKKVTTLLRVEYAYYATRRRKYYIARNASAQPMPITRITASGKCAKQEECVHDEIFWVTIPAQELRSAAGSGYALKIFAKVEGHTKLVIPKAAITALFAKMGGINSTQG